MLGWLAYSLASLVLEKSLDHLNLDRCLPWLYDHGWSARVRSCSSLTVKGENIKKIIV